MERHPELFELAKQYEKINPETGERYTWSGKESLEELRGPSASRRSKSGTKRR